MSEVVISTPRSSATDSRVRKLVDGVEGGPYDVEFVVGAVDLGEAVGDARHLEYRADGGAGDDTGTGARREEADGRRAGFPLDLVGDGGPCHGEIGQVLLGVLLGLLDRVGHLGALGVAVADPAPVVAGDDEGAEAEAATALHRRAGAVDVDGLGFQIG